MPGENILVIGGDQNGMLAADYLSEGGRQVTVAEAHGHFAQKLAGHDRWYLLNRQNAKCVRRAKDVRGVEVGGNDDVWLVTDVGREMLPGVDTIVFASDRRSDRGLLELANKMGAKTYVVGDAHDAVSENTGPSSPTSPRPTTSRGRSDRMFAAAGTPRVANRAIRYLRMGANSV